MSLILRSIFITSSLTPSIVLYSCDTPSIDTSVTAAPGIDERRILLKAFPRVWPNPRSKGSSVTFDKVSEMSST